MNLNFGTKPIGGIICSRLFVIVCCLLVLLAHGCTSKTQVHDVGGTETMFDNGFSVYNELNAKSLVVAVDNLYGTAYSLWVEYSKDCPDIKANTRKKLYEGKELHKDMIIDFPKADKNCKQNISVEILDSKGESIYSSRILTILNIGELRYGNE